MKLRKTTFCLLMGMIAIVATPPTLAEEHCLLGTWVAAEESIVPSDNSELEAMAGMSMAVEVLSGGVTLEILESGTVRVTYDEYELATTITRAGRESVLKASFTGSSEGDVRGDGDSTISMRRFSDVEVSAWRLMQGGEWIFVGSDEETPPHEESDYDFECNADELILTKSNHSDYANATYRGRFVRDD